MFLITSRICISTACSRSVQTDWGIVCIICRFYGCVLWWMASHSLASTKDMIMYGNFICNIAFHLTQYQTSMSNAEAWNIDDPSCFVRRLMDPLCKLQTTLIIRVDLFADCMHGVHGRTTPIQRWQVRGNDDSFWGAPRMRSQIVNVIKLRCRKRARKLIYCTHKADRI